MTAAVCCVACRAELADPDEPHACAFTAPEKARSVVERMLSVGPGRDPKLAALLRALRVARRLGLFTPFLALLPPPDRPEEWDQALMLGAGLALNLVSDGVDVDVEECRRAGGAMLAELYRDDG